MKRAIIFTLTVVLFMISCRKENPARMEATINGVKKEFLFRMTLRGGVQNVFEGFMIRATTGIQLTDGEYLTLLIRGVQPKDYSLTVNLDSVRLQAEVIYRPGGNKDTSLVYVGKSGKITITKVDEDKNYVSGKFSFTVVNTKNANDQIVITNGIFENLKYLKTTLPTEDFNL